MTKAVWLVKLIILTCLFYEKTSTPLSSFVSLCSEVRCGLSRHSPVFFWFIFVLCIFAHSLIFKLHKSSFFRCLWDRMQFVASLLLVVSWKPLTLLNYFWFCMSKYLVFILYLILSFHSVFCVFCGFCPACPSSVTTVLSPLSVVLLVNAHTANLVWPPTEARKGSLVRNPTEGYYQKYI